MFYVDWNNPKQDIKKYKLELKSLNSLIGVDNFDKQFSKLLKEYPLTVNLLPTLYRLAKKGKSDLAAKNNLEVINSSNFCQDELLDYDFNLDENVVLSDLDIEEYLGFAIKIGIKFLFTDLLKSDLIDYATGKEQIR